MRFYLDEHMSRALYAGLEKRGHEVIMAVDVGMEEKDDLSEHLEYATRENAVLITRDFGFAGRAMKRLDHAGVICWTGLQTDVGGMIAWIHELAQKYDYDKFKGRVFWIK
jgi:predicted nuclease of predicted toxin-antitoxin system